MFETPQNLKVCSKLCFYEVKQSNLWCVRFPWQLYRHYRSAGKDLLLCLDRPEAAVVESFFSVAVKNVLFYIQDVKLCI